LSTTEGPRAGYSAEPLRSEGETIGCLGVALDITDRKRSEQQVLYQATHDALTGLGNYREFVETLEREVRRADRGHHSFAFYFWTWTD